MAFAPSYPVEVPGRWEMGRTAWETSSCLTAMEGMEPLREAREVGDRPDALLAVWARFAREDEPLEAAVMLAWREVSSCIMRSFCSCLSACTVWACWRRLSRRENCLEQWQVKGRSPVCFLDVGEQGGGDIASGRRGQTGGGGGADVPDVPGEMLAPAKDHPALAVASALERLCGGGTIAGLAHARASGGHLAGVDVVRGEGLLCDDGGHGGVGVVVDVDVGRGVVCKRAVGDDVDREAVGGLLAVHWPQEPAGAQPKRCLKSQ